MASTNPAFGRPEFSNRGYAGRVQDLPDVSPDTLDQMYNRPAASSVETDRMTVEDTLAKTALAFVVLLAGAAVGWFVAGLLLPALVVALVLGFVNAFKRVPSPALILSYAATQGIAVGAISGIFESAYEGAVVQALLATVIVIGVTLALFMNGKIRTSPKLNKIFFIGMISYAVFSLVNLGLGLFGVGGGFGLRTGFIGIVIGLIAVALATYSLVMDFELIQQGVRNRAPRIFGWTGAYGILVTVVWMYLELLRLIAIFRQ
ncbi:MULTISPECIES: Bax inhibitor-1/YccA family membrane protein [unclassified Rathayibacter]|uniref:Bax inhibitor-1/YccA family protein n=1 Tax=unclassified Rathayibacter TaxID=2609250 RepID=UPI00188B0418|nr:MULTISPECIES: Bax inhibitor-1/YccA family protein [unclassified Rathayibacter]MBF4461659.1 Bax inhibitor-1/YccA family protein [Rathayibacter sp. VKM Ac-2879]MBF4503070.1 Bax inhibitor-1/YccA family protein [Rathayibacter sp. VKM Ac-2878]